jgi:hypothetical protein
MVDGHLATLLAAFPTYAPEAQRPVQSMAEWRRIMEDAKAQGLRTRDAERLIEDQSAAAVADLQRLIDASRQ